MDMIQNHFEQIALSASAIAELPFPRPKVFTNALLQPHDITSLIRDTEVHEQALFFAATSEAGGSGTGGSGARKSLAPGVSSSSGEGALAGLKPGTAVGRILGSDLQRRIRRSERAKGAGGGGGDVDVGLLLEGAEKLCAAYPMPGTMERIHAMAARHQKLQASIALYEDKLARQAAEFERIHGQARHADFVADDVFEEADVGGGDLAGAASGAVEPNPPSAKLEDEEEELRMLEEKKKGLEERVTGLERDLGGLRR